MIGDKLSNAMNLFGHPKCINTAKCLQTAGEKGVDVEVHIISSGADVQQMSPLGSAPVLKDLDNVVYGTGAILSYLDDKGFGPSLVPRNGVVRARMYQWIHVAMDYVQAQIAGGGDEAVVNQAMDLLEEQFKSSGKRGLFIAGEFSLADIHWSACVNTLQHTGKSELVSSRSAIQAWWGEVQKHPSTSKENLVPYSVLPTKEDMDSGNMRNVAINVL